MSEHDQLEAFLRSKATSSQGSTEAAVDWNARRDKWLAAIDNLYALMKSWLRPLEADGTVRYLVSKVTLNEEPIGAYEVNVLAILIGKQRIAFHPKGTLIIGADGRVDARGQRAVRTLVWNDGEWFVVERAPRLITLPFNEDSFRDLLQEVME